jgi:hypothetical protein
VILASLGHVDYRLFRNHSVVNFVCYEAEADGVSYFVFIKVTMSETFLGSYFKISSCTGDLELSLFTCEFGCPTIRSLTSYGIKTKISLVPS